MFCLRRSALPWLSYCLSSIPCSGTLFYAVLLLKLILPHSGGRACLSSLLIRVAQTWIDGNSAIIDWTQRIEWDIQGLEGLRRDDWYLVSSNHQSWVDIVVLQRVLNRRILFLKFFIKQPLIWVPLLGGVWLALDFPFMQRHSADYLAQHPEARDQDWETTRRLCERFHDTPTTILNFLEGTRFRLDKHTRQQSPYRHLLRPKSGGLGFVLAILVVCHV
ncbi:MAG: 1-acyl-sn-glycerol-3-phosphate acyltransferase [Candidatus Competibacteraceae bacterium]|nr:1-acyl-sn-glycerol-3-phosphate acyltransferase [Candidatus Competibacteraceae bacterium]